MKQALILIFLFLSLLIKAQNISEVNGVALTNLSEVEGVPVANIAEIDGIPLILTTLKDSLVAVWELDESSGTTADDAYSTNDGTLTNTAFAPSAGKLSGCVYYDGDGDRLVITSSESNFDNLRSVFAWVRVNSFPSSGNLATIISKGYDGINTESLFFRIYNNGGTLEFNFGSWTTSGGNVGATWTISGWNTGEWHHLAGVYNNHSYKIYFDGSEVASTNSATTFPNNNQNLTIGAWTEGSNYGRYLNGYIDQPGVSNGALTSTEISDLYYLGNGLTYSNW